VAGGCFPTSLPGAEDQPFKDMPAGSYAHDEAIALLDAGITNGCRTDPRLYCPNCPLRRLQAVTFLLRAEGIEPDSPASPTFDDVAPEDWFYPFVETAYALGIATGCTATSFCPRQDVTRAELAGFLQRTRGWALEQPATATFSDVATDHESFQEIETIAARCIDDGCGDDAFCPDDPASRALTAIYLDRAYELSGPYSCSSGSGGSSTGGAGTGGGTAAGGASSTPSPGVTGSDDGCDCGTTASSAGRGSLALAAALLLLLRRRRD
jgi:MYXO-CTERM domain-containing protein